MKITYMFDDGLKVEGTVEQIMTIAKSLNKTLDLSKLPTPHGYYMSKTKGLVTIKSMDTIHLRNAVIAGSKHFLDQLRTQPFTTGKQFLLDFSKLIEDKQLNQLIMELVTRS